MTWKKDFNKGKEITLVTATTKGVPNANIVVSLGFVEGKLLVANCQMNTTIKNIKENKSVCVVGGYYRLKGIAKTYTSGKCFDLCVEKNKKYRVDSAILITIKEVFNLDKVKPVKI